MALLRPCQCHVGAPEVFSADPSAAHPWVPPWMMRHIPPISSAGLEGPESPELRLLLHACLPALGPDQGTLHQPPDHTRPQLHTGMYVYTKRQNTSCRKERQCDSGPQTSQSSHKALLSMPCRTPKARTPGYPAFPDSHTSEALSFHMHSAMPFMCKPICRWPPPPGGFCLHVRTPMHVLTPSFIPRDMPPFTLCLTTPLLWNAADRSHVKTEQDSLTDLLADLSSLSAKKSMLRREQDITTGEKKGGKRTIRVSAPAASGLHPVSNLPVFPSFGFPFRFLRSRSLLVPCIAHRARRNLHSASCALCTVRAVHSAHCMHSAWLCTLQIALLTTAAYACCAIFKANLYFFFNAF